MFPLRGIKFLKESLELQCRISVRRVGLSGMMAIYNFKVDNLVKICSALEQISNWQDKNNANDTHCLLQTLRSSDFIISSICLSDVLGTTVSLSRVLQTSSINLKRATEAINDTMSVLRQKREQVNTVF
ncbi:unnamed protein product [Psylliodes chrysocephalus]|uniref:Uncharacterized protein n=1 Tax=Psylliodes chrysocephalus TaxID=3402493 RepID=A0A9P0CHK7_9CUCU|nr:unnamed protein product [Psylliodes chrysocephala]